WPYARIASGHIAPPRTPSLPTRSGSGSLCWGPECTGGPRFDQTHGPRPRRHGRRHQRAADRLHRRESDPSRCAHAARGHRPRGRFPVRRVPGPGRRCLGSPPHLVPHQRRLPGQPHRRARRRRPRRERHRPAQRPFELQRRSRTRRPQPQLRPALGRLRQRHRPRHLRRLPRQGPQPRRGRRSPRLGGLHRLPELLRIRRRHRRPGRGRPRPWGTLIVDGAWGPHFGFHPSLPESPTRLGADLVISSTPEPAGSLTQSAMLHLGKGPFAEVLESLIARAMTMTASTSSSALLMGSLDIARRALATGEDAIGASIDTAIRFRELLETDERFADIGEGFAAFPDIAETDLLRVPIDVSATGISAHWIRDRLMTEHDLYFEMSTDTTLVAVIGAGKTPDVDSVFATLIGVIESDEGQAQSSTGRAQADFPELPAPGPVRV